MESTQRCPNCDKPASATATLCPQCGATLPRIPASSVWPPPPSTGLPPAVSEKKLVTASESGDVVLGIGLTILICILGGIGFIVAPVAYFLARPSVPFFARGIGYGFLAGAAVVLGAFALCFYGLSYDKG